MSYEHGNPVKTLGGGGTTSTTLLKPGKNKSISNLKP